MSSPAQPARVPVLSFDDLCDREPRLRELEREAAAFAASLPHDQEDRGIAAWYGQMPFHGRGFKARVVGLIGFERNPPGYVEPAPMKRLDGEWGWVDLEEWFAWGERHLKAIDDALARLPETEREREKLLRTSFAYDVAYRHLFSVLTHGSPAM